MNGNTRSNSVTRSSQPRLRCAIYTRKSTEEGLDQEFNSLDAQREACVSFVASQIGLGWKPVSDRYDDGGISGGTMERPALQRLLQDIRDRKIDVVVVYKIDRLTRSLADFAKIVEVFDGNGVSFVSVTQQFNTTTSMGRLTLNVLLSFAQFEREVTAERIRDKIAASRKKGMWMGGTVPLGYRVQDRKLVVNEPEASFVRGLFRRYLDLKSVPKLAREVSQQAAVAYNPENCSRDLDGESAGNAEASGNSICERYHLRPMFPGMLYKLLVNPLYIGKVRHRHDVYDGEHEPLIDKELFEAVRKQLALGAPVPKGTAMHGSRHLLTGLLFDDTGDRMSPTHGTNNGRRYRYYVSSRVRRSPQAVPDSWRVPAKEIEKTVRDQAVRILQDKRLIASWIEEHASADLIQYGVTQAASFAATLADEKPADRQRKTTAMMFRSITLSQTFIRFEVKASDIVSTLVNGETSEGVKSDHYASRSDAITASGDADDTMRHVESDRPDDLDDVVTIEVAINLRRRGKGMRIVIDSPYVQPEPDPSLVDLIARAHIYLDRLTRPEPMGTSSIASAFKVDRADVGRILPLAFLSPKMLSAILTGSQPASLSARHLARTDLSMLWTEQDAALQ